MKYLAYFLLSCMLGCQKPKPEPKLAEILVPMVQKNVDDAYARGFEAGKLEGFRDGFRDGDLQGMRLVECDWLNSEYRNGRILPKNYAAMRKRNSMTCEKVTP